MTQISFQDDATGEFIKQWPNWTGVVPAVGDMVVLHFGDNNEEECSYTVSLRLIDGTRPDHIWLFIRKCDYKEKRNMKPFDKVLVRSAEYGLWMPALYGKEKDGLYITSAGWQKYCIPYEGNENLLGTKNEVEHE